jgi:hypothetical protein
MSERTSTRPTNSPTAEGTLHFDKQGKRITMSEFAKPQPYTVTVDAMAEHLAALDKWMRESTPA